MNLVIIEGVGKLETIKKYLGKDYQVMATKGHFRDLPVKTLGVNVYKNFEPEYTIMPDKQTIVKQLKEQAEKAENIYLATDPDREGEAISWHLANVLNIDPQSKSRIVFNEISKNAILKAMESPRELDQKLIDAQQARRVLDRLIGYKLSPVISKKIQPKLSAGRVQSVALKLVVEREKAILNFVPVEYWTLVAKLFKTDKEMAFKSSLVKFKNKKIEISSKDEMDKVLSDLKQDVFKVANIKKTIGKTKPSAPYITSTMLQDASRKLSFTLKKTSMVAQQLYEGVELGSEGKVALVTYIRSDSVRVAPEAVAMAKSFILDNFGAKYYPDKPNFYKTKGDAQDAHEAIRPISLDKTPEQVKMYVSPDQYRLYKMIYDRFLASQMSESTYNLQVVEIENNGYTFKASGKTPVFDGFTAVYGVDKAKKPKKKTTSEADGTETPEEVEEDDSNDSLPELTEGEVLNLSELVDMQKFTKPLPRFTEFTLVSEMENRGIGRPATYSASVNTIIDMNYVQKDAKFLVPTEIGTRVSEFLDAYFESIINVDFTAQMETKLDDVAEKGAPWQDIVKEFFDSFVVQLKNADEDSAVFKIPPKETNEICEKCGKPMVIRMGRYGEFLACSGFPDCKNIRSLNVPKPVGVCPKCGGDIFLKTSKKGAKFYGCGNYPKCDFVSWNLPKPENGDGESKTENKDTTSESIKEETI